MSTILRRRPRVRPAALPAVLALLLVSLAGIGDAPAAAAEPDLRYLLDGLQEIAAPGVPGRLCVYGEDAFPVVLAGAGGTSRAPVAAAARLGDGRVFALGHEGYFGAAALETGDTAALLIRAVRWAGGAEQEDAEPGGPLRVGVRGRPDLVAVLVAAGLDAEEAGPESLESHDVYVGRPWGLPTAELERLARYVEGGGGLVLGGPAWGWQQLNPDLSMEDDIVANLLLQPAGLQWMDGYAERTSDLGFLVDPMPTALSHGGRALDALLAHERGEAPLSAEDLAQASVTLQAAARCAPVDDRQILPRLRSLAEDPSVPIVPSPERPISETDVLGRVVAVLAQRDGQRLPPEEVGAHPAAELFPGAVPAEAPRVARTVVVDAARPRWQGTGLYAAPGEPIAISLPPEAVDLGLELRIGAHSDRLWDKPAWRRFPEVSARWPLDASEVTVASAFGGLVYVEVPDGLAPAELALQVRGAVAAPRFLRGETSAEDWLVERTHPAPWAEVGSDKLVLSVPSASVRELEDPEALMATWDRAMDLAAELAARPPARTYAERIVPDEQISAGYMHAGYPIMTHLDQRTNLVDRAHVLGGNWGLFHEIGHNHQSGDWTFAGTGEVTVNLFTLYLYEYLCGVPVAENDRGSAEFLAAQMAKFDFQDPDFAQWKSDPFLALAMYVQLQQAFGWEAYRELFATYRALPDAERPRDDDEKRDQWLVRFSRQVDRDLGPFFAAWGIPISQEARASLADLPPWLPEDFPPGMEIATPSPSPPPSASPAPSPSAVPTPGARLFLPLARR